MENKRMTIIWSISLLIICVATLIIAGTKLVGVALPDIMIRMLGIVELIALPFFAFASVKRFSKK